MKWLSVGWGAYRQKVAQHLRPWGLAMNRTLRMGFGLAVLSFLAVALYLKDAPDCDTSVSYGDLEAVQRALHDAWVAAPANRPVSDELRKLETKTRAAEVLVDTLPWAAKPDALRRKLEELKAAIDQIVAAGKQLEVSTATADSEFLKKLLEAQKTLKEVADQLVPRQPPGRLKLVLAAFGKLFDLIVSGLWPLITLAAIVLVLQRAQTMGGLANLLGGIQSIKFGANPEIVFKPDKAPEVSKSANETFAQYRSEVSKAFTKEADSQNLARRIERVAEDQVKALVRDAVKTKNPGLDGGELTKTTNDRFRSLRFTVHMKDILLVDAVTQVADYYPTAPGAGRRWSIRYGFIGFVWRLGRSSSLCSVSDKEDDLVRDWGMTRDEIRNFVSRKNSFTAVVIEDPVNVSPVGLFYMDSEIVDVFGVDQDEEAMGKLHQKLRDGCDHQGLTDAIRTIARRLDPVRLDLRIYG